MENILKWIKESRRKNSDEALEEKEFEKFIAKVEGRMDKISAAQKATTQEARAQVALMFENAYTQKKLSEVNNSLRTATWILAIATGIFAYVAIFDSINKDSIFINLMNLFFLLVFILFVVVFLEILKDFGRFVFRLLGEK